MSGADLTYSPAGPFVAFFAETPAGEAAWRELASHSDGTAKFLPAQLPGVLSQLCAAGYRVAKAKPRAPLSADDLDAMLSELTAP
jgi:hypothetical protein